MDDGLLPIEVSITVVSNHPVGNGGTKVNPVTDSPTDVSSNDIVAEEEVDKQTPPTSVLTSNLNNGNNAAGSGTGRRKSSTTNRNRNKSRRLTLTQVCSDEALSKLQQSDPVASRDSDRISNSSSVISSESGTSRTSTSSTSSSLKASPDGKINRIFSMLQMMQETFLQNPPIPKPSAPAEPPQYQQEELPASSSPAIIPTGSVNYSALNSEARKIHNSMQRRQMLYNMSRSQDSIVSIGAGSIANKTNSAIERTRRLGSVTSWTGSQCSVLTEGPPPPLVHAMPYHKDGW